MPEKGNEDKTEAPSDKRRSEARNKGNIAKSTDINSVLVLLAGLLMLKFTGSWMMGHIMAYTREMIMTISHPSSDMAFISKLITRSMVMVCLISWPVCVGVMVIGVIANLIQVGFLFTFEPIMPKFEKINPISGLGRFISLKSFVEMIKNVLKLLIIGFVAFQTVQGEFGKFLGLADSSVGSIFMFMAAVSFNVMLRVALVLLVLAILDYAYQKYENEKSLKMSKQELKEEHKQSEGDPQIKARVKSLQREMARRRMMQEVPKATVVVTNPTHLAIALLYEPREMETPRVLAKGKRLVAEQIKKMAREAGVPIVEDKPLARAMFDKVNPGDDIPMEFFSAVAEILAYVYRLKNKKVAA